MAKLPKDPTLRKMVEADLMHETEVPFEESENEFTEEGKVKLPYTVELSEPIRLTENETIREITFRNSLKAGMVMHLPITGVASYQYGHFVPVIAEMTGQPVIVIKKLAVTDLIACINVVTDFF